MGAPKAGYSPTAEQLLRPMIDDPAAVWMVYVTENGWIQFANTDTPVSYPEKPVFIDLSEVQSIRCKGKKLDCETLGVGAILMPEFVHAKLGLADPSESRMDSETGPTVDLVNQMRVERGLPVRRTYFDPITSQQMRDKEQSTTFEDAKGKRVGTFILDMDKSFQEVLTYKNWCQAEMAAAAKAGRPSSCLRTSIWDQRPVP